MTNEQIEALFEEMVGLLQEARMEAKALRQMLADYKVINEAELELRIKDVTKEERFALKQELYRRAFENALKDRPIQ